MIVVQILKDSIFYFDCSLYRALAAEESLHFAVNKQVWVFKAGASSI